MPALVHAMEDEGFVAADTEVEVVVASVNRDVTYPKIKRAVDLIRGGARFIATNLDPNIPSEDGVLPGSGPWSPCSPPPPRPNRPGSVSPSRSCMNWPWRRWAPDPNDGRRR